MAAIVTAPLELMRTRAQVWMDGWVDESWWLSLLHRYGLELRYGWMNRLMDGWMDRCIGPLA